MSLPIYQTINVKSASLDEIKALLGQDLNLKHPVAINLKNLDHDQQREVIGLIENYFVSHNLSFKFPYPVYVISDHERSVTKLPLVNKNEDLPKFFAPRDSKMNVKESHLIGKNKLLQLEVRNSDTSSNERGITNYGESHRVIFELEEERKFYRTILNRLVKVKKHG